MLEFVVQGLCAVAGADDDDAPVIEAHAPDFLEHELGEDTPQGDKQENVAGQDAPLRQGDVEYVDGV